MEIKLLALDLDGTLTDGGLYISENGMLLKKFNTRDFHGIRILHETSGCKIVIITGAGSDTADEICHRSLPFARIYKQAKDKIACAESAWNNNLSGKVNWEEVAFIGDDEQDIPLLSKVGFAGCPADAHPSVISVVESVNGYITQSRGGNGSVRQFVDQILKINKVYNYPSGVNYGWQK